MTFLVPNYSRLQDPWLGGDPPKVPVFSSLNWNCWTPPPPNKIPEYATCRLHPNFVLPSGLPRGFRTKILQLCLVLHSFACPSLLNLAIPTIYNAISVQTNPYSALDRPFGRRECEAPRFSIKSALERVKAVSRTHRPPLLPRRCSWYSFLLEAESSPRQECGWKDYISQKSQWTHCESNPATFRM